ncbi:MAG: FlgD immunoglobulin-like domain containing protein [bacterium]
MRYFFVSAIIVILILFSGFFLFSTDTIKAESSSDISNKISDKFSSLTDNAKKLIGLESNKVNSVGSSVIVTVTVTNIIEPLIPSEFSLSQNYPNPFNMSTTIEYGLPEQCQISITVYNILGQEVSTLVDGIRPAGLHQVQWDGTNSHGNTVATGVYIYRIETSTYIKTKKMLLVK